MNKIKSNLDKTGFYKDVLLGTLFTRIQLAESKNLARSISVLYFLQFHLSHFHCFLHFLVIEVSPDHLIILSISHLIYLVYELHYYMARIGGKWLACKCIYTYWSKCIYTYWIYRWLLLEFLQTTLFLS